MDDFILYYPDGHQEHQLFGHPERPERIESIREGLMEIGIWQDLHQITPIELECSLLNSIHTPEYMEILEKTCSRGSNLDPDTYTTMASWQLALNAAGGAAAVVESVWNGKFKSGFALSRPPGHHTTRDRGMGFCLINNIAVAAEYLLKHNNAGRLAIVDLDLHHGNGTQDIFWQRSDVAFCSIHQAPFYPGTGLINEIGGGKGRGYTMNLPIPGFSGDRAYHALLHEMVIPFLDRIEPEMILISYGFDTHWRDPLGSLQVSAQCIHQIFKDLNEWTEKNCGGKLAVVLEGGYDLEAGKVCGQAISTALQNKDWQDSLGPSPITEKDSWMETLKSARELWKF